MQWFVDMYQGLWVVKISKDTDYRPSNRLEAFNSYQVCYLYVKHGIQWQQIWQNFKRIH